MSPGETSGDEEVAFLHGFFSLSRLFNALFVKDISPHNM